MKKILIKIFGKENAEKPVTKVMFFAILGTVAALVLAILVLIFSSIGFAIADNIPSNSNTPTDDDGGDSGSSGGGTTQTVQIEYESSTKTALDEKIGEEVGVQSERSSIEGGIYYAAHAQDKLFPDAQSALDNMLVNFYKNNKNKLVIDASKTECNVPYAHNSDGKYSIKIETINEETIVGVALYKWIFDNAHTYGFVYNGNTFTYVGTAAAAYMKTNSNMSHSAFISKIKSVSANISVKVSTVNYQMYYISADATEIKVPKNYNYTVIADGADGYIITVNTSKKISN